MFSVSSTLRSQAFLTARGYIPEFVANKILTLCILALDARER